MTWTGRTFLLSIAAGLAVALMGPAAAAARPAAPAGDIAVTTVPRPPFDVGVGVPITRALFSSPDGSVSCRRVYSEMVWLECLLKQTDEIVRFGPDESWSEVPCRAPHGSETCRLAFGMLYLAPATKAQAARFDGARRIPLERLVNLGRSTVPYPICIADPNLGLSCRTNMDDQVGQQIFLGLAGGIWNCPGYEYVNGETPVPRGSDRCRALRP
jgi:hypothetical protein